MARQPTPTDTWDEPIQAVEDEMNLMFGNQTSLVPVGSQNMLVMIDKAHQALIEARRRGNIRQTIQIKDWASAVLEALKTVNESQGTQNEAAEVKLLAERSLGEMLEDMEKAKGTQGQLAGRDSSGASIMEAPEDDIPTYADLSIAQVQAHRYRSIAHLPEDAFYQHIEKIKNSGGELTSAGMLRLAKQWKREQIKNAYPEPAPLADKQPILIVGKAEELTEIADETVNVIVTSPPYNMGGNHWDMGYRGSRESGIGYDDNLPEQEYQDWQRAVLRELYRVAAPGASLFYNHKVRIRNGQAILPTDWVRKSGWILRQVIVWDRGSTHNHETRLFWPHDEWVLWLTKGKPDLHYPINMPSIWQFHGPVAGTWHPAPFAEELPRRCLQAIGYPGCVVLDPFAGSCTTVKVALKMGYDAIGVDVSAEYLQKARLENGW